MDIAYSKAAFKYLRNLPVKNRQRIIDEIRKVAAGERADVKALGGMKGIYRIRVGDVRVLYQTGDGVMNILAVGSRGDIYK